MGDVGVVDGQHDACGLELGDAAKMVAVRREIRALCGVQLSQKNAMQTTAQ